MKAGAFSAALFAALLLMLQFGPAIGLAGWRLTEHPAWALIGFSRDLLAALVMLAALPALLVGARTRLPVSARWALGLALAFAAIGSISPAPLGTMVLNLRRLLLVPLLYVALLLLPWTSRGIAIAQRALLSTCVAVATIGLLERLAPEALWTQALDVVGYASANPLDPFGALPFHDSGRFFSWDLQTWTGAPVRRAIATYLEPTTLAAAMAAGLVMALARGTSTLAPALLAACGLMTLSKSFWIFLPLLLAWRFVGWPSPRQVLLITALACALALGAATGAPLIGPLAHIGGLASALQNLADGRWFGEGIGMAGNYAVGEDDTGAESGLGNVIAQVGVFAVLPLLWLRALATDVLRTASRRHDAAGRWLAAWLLFWLVSFLFSASSLGVGGNAIGFMMLALYLHPAADAGER